VPRKTAKRWLEELAAARDDKGRVKAIKALGTLGDDALIGVPQLLESLQSDSWKERAAAAGALGKLQDPRAVEPLGIACRDTKKTVVRAAAWALSALGTQARGVGPEVLRATEEGRLDVKSGLAVLRFIGFSVPSRDRKRLLARTRVPSHAGPVKRPVAELQAGLDSPVAAERARCARGLAEWRDEAAEVAPRLVPLLADSSPVVRRDASHALSKLKRFAAAELIEALQTPDPNFFGRVLPHVCSLGPRGRRALPVLMERLSDPNAIVRRGAATAVGAFGGPEVVGPLVDLLEDERRTVQRCAALALRRFLPLEEGHRARILAMHSPDPLTASMLKLLAADRTQSG